MGISKLRVKEAHGLQHHRQGELQIELQHPIGHQQSHQIRKLGEPEMVPHQIIEHQQALQNRNLDLPQKDLRHLTDQHHPAHQIGHQTGLPHPDHRVHPDLQVHVEAGAEEDKNIVVPYSHKKRGHFI